MAAMTMIQGIMSIEEGKSEPMAQAVSMYALVLAPYTGDELPFVKVREIR